MKKTIIFLEILFFILFVKLASSQVAVNIKGGMNISFMKTSFSYEQNKAKAGINIGFTSEIPIIGPLGIETGLIYTTKGRRSVFTDIYNPTWWQYDTTTYKSNININYLELPVRVTGSLNLGNVRLIGSAGAYCGLGVGGKISTDETTNGNTISYTDYIKFGNDPMDSYFKLVDWGLSFGLGMNVKHFHMGVSYDLGLANISPYRDDGYVSKNRAWSIDMGYRFDFGSLNSQDYKARIRAVKRCKKQEKLFAIVSEDEDLRVRQAAFRKLNDNSLNRIIKEANDPGLILAAKIRLGLTNWDDAFSGNISLNNVIGAAAIVDTPKPASYSVVAACHNFIQLGDASRIPELIYLLNTYGDKLLAEDFMNCGESTLEDAGCIWGRSHGFNCTTGHGSSRVRWGSKK
jgi:hypothetical protein